MGGALRATLAWLLWLSRLVHVSAVSTVEDLHHEVRVGTAHILIAPEGLSNGQSCAAS